MFLELKETLQETQQEVLIEIDVSLGKEVLIETHDSLGKLNRKHLLRLKTL